MSKVIKKVYRSSDDSIIAGVCGGLAEYFGIDSTLVRILFVLLAVGGGAGVLIYIILALVIPKKGLNSGKQNIEDIAENIENGVKNISSEIKGGKKINVFGVILILLGLVILWNKFSPIRIDGEIFWPVVLILSGMWIFFK